MSFEPQNVFISLGDRCIPAQTFVKLGIKQETLPFDWVRGNAQITWDCLQSNFVNFYEFVKKPKLRNHIKHIKMLGMFDYMQKKHPNFPETHINYYGQYFVHYQDYTPEELRDTLQRRVKRFWDLLDKCQNENRQVIFVRCRLINDPFDGKYYYKFVQKIDAFIEEKYPKLRYIILNIESKNDYIKKRKSGHIVNVVFNEPIVVKRKTPLEEQPLISAIIERFIK